MVTSWGVPFPDSLSSLWQEERLSTKAVMDSRKNNNLFLITIGFD